MGNRYLIILLYYIAISQLHEVFNRKNVEYLGLLHHWTAVVDQSTSFFLECEIVNKQNIINLGFIKTGSLPKEKGSYDHILIFCDYI